MQDRFPIETSGLPSCSPTKEVVLPDGGSLDLQIVPVAKQLRGSTVRMLAYNGSIPGPTLRVPQGARIAVDIANDGDLDATVHWHGLRLANRFDGTHHTQEPIPLGGRFTAHLDFPDPGIYWYHPHIREDYGQELGLYGALVVEPTDPDYWAPVNRELVLTLDDILLDGEGNIAPFHRTHPTHTAMGRFGDVFLVAGETDLEISVFQGEVVRLYLINTANTRVFNIAIPGARLKLVGGDSGRYEHEQHEDVVLLAPSERAVVDAMFTDTGTVTLQHRTPDRSYALARFNVSETPASPSFAEQFETLRTDPDLVEIRQRVSTFLDTEPAKTLGFVAEMDMADVDADDAGYGCPMHPEVTSQTPGRCPECGMKLLPTVMLAPSDHDAGHGMHHDGTDHEHHAHDHSGDEPGRHDQRIEWEDDMVEINRMTTPDNMRWFIVDHATGARNQEIDWRFRVGDQVKIRLVNEIDSDHPMHHPFHVHGAGRFLVLRRDGVDEPNLVWKDTVLVQTGQTVDILLEVTNPGTWMAHCHIAEHHEGGMMFSFRVDPESDEVVEK